jgi:vancomycin permeability regulator SanA
MFVLIIFGIFLEFFTAVWIAVWFVCGFMIFPTVEVLISKVALVFGAGFTLDGKPFLLSEGKIITPAKLFFKKNIERILTSADHRRINCTKPAAMKLFPFNLGVPEEVLVLDLPGRRTHSPCYRVKHIFDFAEVYLIAQIFHWPSALLICNSLGKHFFDVFSDFHKDHCLSVLSCTIHEIPAKIIAFLDLCNLSYKPILELA